MPTDKADITDAGPRLRAMNDALEASDRLQAEIARLQAENELLRGYRDEAEAEASIASLAAQSLRLTDAEREAILFCVSCAQDYRDKLDGSEERATQMIQTAMRFAMPQVGPAPVERPRTASVTDVGGAGPTLTEAEREALEVAIEYVGSAYAVEHHARTIRGLLERTRCS